ncbi:uncharacterized protein F5Z01DRAFT_185830 [Emericellopsis atlantica]|uniref:Uncharacterized protein n=1 Tax=Emericellopsis atlantica TaxID=2614577 RepID=A0A9P8CN79_9HYPO|nr:uncharacterized protein F5Z01DRAFT_185830 [Emericellopsis atlantica]KAG9252795.1 hypothetical protein F5Z01DRAFT_185830 [Emericellopsis atlantica]
MREMELGETSLIRALTLKAGPLRPHLHLPLDDDPKFNDLRVQPVLCVRVCVTSLSSLRNCHWTDRCHHVAQHESGCGSIAPFTTQLETSPQTVRRTEARSGLEHDIRRARKSSPQQLLLQRPRCLQAKGKKAWRELGLISQTEQFFARLSACRRQFCTNTVKRPAIGQCPVVPNLLELDPQSEQARHCAFTALRQPATSSCWARRRCWCFRRRDRPSSSRCVGAP